MSVIIHPTGEDDYTPEDRRTLTASFGRGNTDQLEVFLTHSDPVFVGKRTLGWYRVADLQAIVNAAVANYQNGNPQ